ncbi:spore coat protein YlbD [Cerasibacillus sp. JNUCC 74]
MSNRSLHPSVIEFKQFINSHPKLIEEIRKSGKPLQEIYEKWALLGEDDPYWTKYKQPKKESNKEDKKQRDSSKKGKNTELFSQLLKMTESIDLAKVQQQMEHFSSSISTIQELIGQFKQTNDTKQAPNEQMGWFRD